MTGLVERVLITLPHAQRISASWYFGCIPDFINYRAGKNTSRPLIDKCLFWKFYGVRAQDKNLDDLINTWLRPGGKVIGNFFLEALPLEPGCTVGGRAMR
jgi:hypothetical protein